MRSWTAALTFRVIDNDTGPTDFTIAFTFSLKATPSQHVGDDTVNPYHLRRGMIFKPRPPAARC